MSGIGMVAVKTTQCNVKPFRTLDQKKKIQKERDVNFVLKVVVKNLEAVTKQRSSCVDVGRRVVIGGGEVRRGVEASGAL